MATKSLEYPSTRSDDTIDSRAGVDFPDPYRWLEAGRRRRGAGLAAGARPARGGLRAAVASLRGAARSASPTTFRTASAACRASPPASGSVSEIPQGSPTQACASRRRYTVRFGAAALRSHRGEPRRAALPPPLDCALPERVRAGHSACVVTEASANTIRLIDVANGELLSGRTRNSR